MFKKVLIATDGSEHATKAVGIGADIASKYDAEVLLVHVLMRHEVSEDLKRLVEIEHLADERGEPLATIVAAVPSGRYPAVTVSQRSPEPDKMLSAIAEQLLRMAEETVRSHGVTKVSQRIMDGKPVNAILDLVKSEDVDLLVVGTRGLTDAHALLMGSVSHKLAHLSPVTCVAVK